MISSARLVQSPIEVKRYMIDWTAQLTDGEKITGLVANISPLNNPPPPVGSPDLVINTIVIAPKGNQAVFYASGGLEGYSYEVSFVATTSIAQIFQDIVEFDIVSKT